MPTSRMKGLDTGVKVNDGIQHTIPRHHLNTVAVADMDSFWSFASLDVFLKHITLVRLASCWGLFWLLRALYNVSPLHPLSHIPGPKLAAATFLYEAWFDLVRGGRYTHEIRRLHAVYGMMMSSRIHGLGSHSVTKTGPVVRINPEELHFNDIGFSDEIYAAGGRRRDKQTHFLNFMAGPITQSMFATVDHDHHRLRRNAVNKFFSRAQILKLETNIKEMVDQLCEKDDPSSCFTADVISNYCFDEPFGFVRQPNWEPNFREPLNAMLGLIYVFRFFPLLKILVDILPLFAKWVGGDIGRMLKESNEAMPARVRKATEDVAAGKVQDNASIFAAIIGSSLPDVEKTDRRLGGEGFSMISAGTETTAWTLTVATFHLLNQPTTLERLSEELRDSDALNKSWFALEKLPYLGAVVNEALRLSYSVTARTPRIAPYETLSYRGQFQGRPVNYKIPAGTPMGMSSGINHHNEDVYPNSYAFRPERWLEASADQRRQMESSLTSFGKGSRICLGMQLAYANMYLALAALTLRVFPSMKLFETDVTDVAWDCDYFVPVPRKWSKGVRVLIDKRT
ncbi:Cyrochrome P450 monooxygenase [Apiospora marii]|uniref:Cyrochrome P450 monooxygenase n=1 Tax=Apiospora marii TaxID=335849 RepID=UPI00312DD3A3